MKRGDRASIDDRLDRVEAFTEALDSYAKWVVRLDIACPQLSAHESYALRWAKEERR